MSVSFVNDLRHHDGWIFARAHDFRDAAADGIASLSIENTKTKAYKKKHEK